MKCRHCGIELEEDDQVCPNCDMPVAKLRVSHVILLSVAALVVLVVLTLVIMKDQGVDLSGLNPGRWFGGKNDQVAATVPQQTEPTAAVEDTQFVYDLTRDSYTATEEDLEGQAAKVAAKIGEVELTNADLQAYYWYGVYNFVTQYQSYFSQYGMDLTAMGLDLTLPLDQQKYMEGVITWQRFFLEAALTDWHKYRSLALQAEKEGYEMSEEMVAQLEKFMAQVEESWKSGGYASLEEMIKAELGPLCNEESYREYLKTYYYAMDYFDTHYATMEPTEEEVEAYFTAHEQELEFTKETVDCAVRHILIEPKGGTKDESGNTTYSEEEWEACRAEAQAILDQWKTSDGTEAGFAKLAAEKSADGGSSSNGGLYEGLNQSTNFVTEFKEWYLDSSRQIGDTGLVKTTYGYHIMYYSAEETVWQENCHALAWQEKANTFVEKIMETWPMTIQEDQIAIGNVDFSGQ